MYDSVRKSNDHNFRFDPALRFPRILLEDRTKLLSSKFSIYKNDFFEFKYYIKTYLLNFIISMHT